MTETPRLGDLLDWMDGQGLGAGPASDVERLAGGTQNLMLRFRRGDERYVLRKPPPHPTQDASKTIAREIQVLTALAGTAAPHPRMIAACMDDQVLGSVFYLMEAVDGFNAAVALPRSHAGDPAIRRQMGFSLVDGLLALGAVDYEAVGLASFGRPDGFLERQAPRWLAQLQSYSKHQAWPGASALPHVEGVARWLEQNRPRHFTPGIIHGDYHLANVMFRYDGPKLAAIIDWEMSTLGDPLLDLGWVLAVRPDEDEIDDSVPASAAWRGLPPNDALVAHYRQGSTRDLSSIEWYVVLACFKLGIVLEGSHARACAGKADAATGDRLHVRAVGLLDRASRISGVASH